MELRFDHKAVGITGAGSTEGIGFAVAKKFLESGARAAIFGRNKEELEKAVESLSSLGEVRGYLMDVSSEEQIKEGFAKMEQELGSVDIWVNNAGIYPQCALMDMDTKHWDKTMEVNLKSVFICAKEAYKRMKDKGGVILNMVSYAALIASAGSGAYAAGKSAVYSLTKTLAAELAPYHIRVNGVIPGVIETKMTKPVLDLRKEELERAIALKRLGLPEEIANAAVFLASDAASYLTGTFIEVSGGKLCVQNPDYGWKAAGGDI